MEITQSLVKDLFDYKDGFLYWKVRLSIRVKFIGAKAGCITKKNGKQYYYTCIYGKSISVHRLIFLWHKGYLPEVVDHEDRNSLNNLIDNLRDSTQQQNSCNKTKRAITSSDYLGVHLCKKTNKFRAHLKSNGKNYRSKRLFTQEDAALEYNKLAVKHHGEFANLNIILLT